MALGKFLLLLNSNMLVYSNRTSQNDSVWQLLIMDSSEDCQFHLRITPVTIMGSSYTCVYKVPFYNICIEF